MAKFKNLQLAIAILFFILLSSILFSTPVYSATTQTYLVENTTWEQNLTGIFQGSIAFGDIDNDGDLDLALTGAAGGSNENIKIYENNGTSFDENSTWQQNLTGVNYGSLMFGDIDNDGDLDLALTGCNRGADAVSACTNGFDLTIIYENNGTSFDYNSSWSQNLTAMYRSSLSLGDIDRDGDLDMVITGTSTVSGWDRSAKVYLNNGTSLVVNKKWEQNLTGLSDSFLVLGDVNNDEDLDLILSGKDSNSNKVTKVYLNNDTAFEESKQWYLNLHAVNEPSLVLGDFDSDSDLDLSLTGCCDHHRIYQNNGSSFVEVQTETTDGGVLIGILESSQALGDYDNDGDLDIITTGREGYTTLYLGYNNGTFSSYSKDPESIVQNLKWSSIAWSDFDNDTDLDLIEVGFNIMIEDPLTYSNNISLTTSNTKPTPPISNTNYTTSEGEIHLGWSNGSDVETPSNGLYYNLRVGSSSGGNQIISGKYGGGEDNGYFGNMQQRKNFTLKTGRLQSNTEYFWSVQTIDTGLRTSSWSLERNFTTKGDLIAPTISFNLPVDNYNTTNQVINFTITVEDNINVSNVSLYGNWTGNWHQNHTNSTGLNNTWAYNFSKNITTDGNYIWGIKACDNSSLCSITENRTFTIDTAYPLITIISPANNSAWTQSSNPIFQYNTTDLALINCSLVIDNSNKQTDYTIQTNTDQEFTQTLSNGVYKWNINCTDSVNYQNNSEARYITINFHPGTGGGISTGSGKRASTQPTRIKEIPKPVKKIQIKEEHEKQIQPKPEPPKPILTKWFETILAFLISLFLILSYTWIIKEDLKK